MKRVSLLLFLILFSASCAVQNTNDDQIKNFLTSFEEKISASENDILQLFKLSHEANASQEGIMKVLQILQNKNEQKDSLHCSIDFNNPKIVKQENKFSLTLQVVFTSIEPNVIYEKKSQLELILSPFQGKYYVSEFLGNNVFNDYQNAINELKYSKNREKDIASKKLFFDQAEKIKKLYDLDSVVWYTQYKDSIYYYAILGPWHVDLGYEKSFTDVGHKMGLISESGRIVIPIEYNLISTIAFEQDDVIEVKKDGLVGQFSIEGKLIVEPIYNQIVPFEQNGVYALVKKENKDGWLDNFLKFHEGLPNEEAIKYIQTFSFLNNKQTINKDNTTITEVLNPEHIGYGIVMPTQHFVCNNLLPEIVSDIYLGETTNGWGNTSELARNVTFYDKVVDNFSALFVYLNDTYVEGREEFYTRSQLIIIDHENNHILTEELYGDDITFIQIDSTIIELRISGNLNEEKDYGYNRPEIWYAPRYQYFQKEDGIISKLKSNRTYDFTSFVKIDSSYLEGTFYTFNEDTQTYTESNLPNEETLALMRNEILADYGYIFKDEAAKEHFKSFYPGYNPRYTSYSEFIDIMTDIDKQNLNFLEKIIGTLNKNPSI